MSEPIPEEIKYGIRAKLATIKEKCPQEYDALVEHLRNVREFHFARLRRNIETPNTNSHQYWIITGEMMASDDIINVILDSGVEEDENR